MITGLSFLMSGRRSNDYSLVISSGGSRAILGGAGGAAALHLAGIQSWHSIGGISGGSFPAVLLARGYSAPELIRLALELDFRTLVSRQAGLCKSLWAFVLKEYYETYNRPDHGILATDAITGFIDRHVPEWPRNFWTMAVTAENHPVLFTSDGVFEYGAGNTPVRLSDRPAPLGLAIRATCTIPGIITPVKYAGKHLYDGALSQFGMCPAGLPVRYFGADPRKTVAFCLGEDFSKGWFGAVRHFWKWVWNVPPDPDWGPETNGVISIRPDIDHIHALKFQLNPDQKWLAVILGFRTAVERLSQEGLLTGPGLATAERILAQLGDPSRLAWSDDPSRPLLVDRAERAFKDYGLF